MDWDDPALNAMLGIQVEAEPSAGTDLRAKDQAAAKVGLPTPDDFDVRG